MAAMAALLLCSALAAQTPDPKQLFDDALGAQQRGDFAAAIDGYQKVLKLNPGVTPAWMNLGIALVQLGKFDDAISSYKSGLALDPQNRQIQFYLALAYYKKGDAANASRQFEELWRADPTDLRVATLLGASYLAEGESGSALALLAPRAESASGDLDFCWVFGSALVASGRLREGAELVEKVAKQRNSAEAWLLSGQTLLRMNESIRARDDLETAARLDPSLAGVQTALAQAREKNADYKGAIEAFRKAVEQNPKDFNAWLGLGSDQYFIRDLDAARLTLKRALELDPGSAPARYAMALVEKSQAQPDLAAADLEQAVKARPDWLEAHVELAALYFQLHRTADGARERQIVDKLSDEQRNAGPGSFR